MWLYKMPQLTFTCVLCPGVKSETVHDDVLPKYVQIHPSLLTGDVPGIDFCPNHSSDIP